MFNPPKTFQTTNNDFISMSSIDNSNYHRSIQPIRYKDPSAK